MTDSTPQPTQNGQSAQPNGVSAPSVNGASSSSSSNPSTLAHNPAVQSLATRLYTACRTGDLPLLTQALSAGLPPNLTNDKGDTLLMLAAYHGHIELVKLLLRKGADPNRINDRGQSILAGAVFKKEEGVVRALCEGVEGDGGVEGGETMVADPDLGHPTAAECVGMFHMEEEMGGWIEGARRRVREQRERGANGGGGSG